VAEDIDGTVWGSGASADGDIRISDGSGGMNAISINNDGALKIDWSDCPMTEDTFRAIAKEEAKDVLRLKTKELKEELDNDSPIRIMRRKVTEWLRS